ncbi:MAG: filamentous hemagglutinin N-terminal domain-containing protein, partial [Tolypothrix sp. T3-bin4]|nr:filamentous hemagglutinin N-terminal domain-containing protein [Tolypothrix sp. T3-bin4]
MNQARYPQRATIKNILSLCLISTAFSFALPVQGQITPDNTLGAEASRLNQNQIIKGALGDKIEGGATRGSNLFHSFSEFNIQDGQSVYFANPTGIENILTRVTGGKESNIFGTLGVSGAANLFLMNPAGIVFGQNAQLDVQGSFVGTTANGVQFGNQELFSATNPQTPSLLTVGVPVGLQYGNNPGAIQAQGATLQVQGGQSLTLAGGAVNIDGAELLAPGGQVKLAGVASSGGVGLTQSGQEWRLSLPERLTRADVAIGNDTVVDVRAGGGGSIGIDAQNLTLTETSLLRAGIRVGSNSPSSQAGDIDLHAIGTTSINNSTISNDVQMGALGNGGNINITTGSLSLTNIGNILTITGGHGNAGNVTIAARDTVSFDGFKDGLATGVFNIVEETGLGNGGNVNITTGSLSLANGGVIRNTIIGYGNAGNVTITARDTVSLNGNAAIFSAVEPGAIGQGGNISIITGTLSLTNGAIVSGITLGQGKAGNIKITAGDTVFIDGVNSDGLVSAAVSAVAPGAIGQGGDISITTGILSLSKGAAVDVSTFGQGDAGNISIMAIEAVFIDGVGSYGRSSGVFSNVIRGAEGRGGRISVNTGLFSITNRGVLSASSGGQGDAGNLDVNALQFRLDNQGSIEALTASGQGGNIKLQVQDLLLLRRGSKISTTAGTDQAGGNGGNITFDGKFIVAIPNENSDISANAFSGNGGNIQINSQGIFGIDRRPNETEKSDITASSELGVSGVININTPDNSSIQNSFTQLPPNVIDTNALIANSCIARGTKRQENSFTITGSGALRN